VVDVIRAFTTAAAWLASGVSRVVCVDTIEGARTAQAATPAAILVGEQWGRRPESFDLTNSPRTVSASVTANDLVVLLSQNGTPALLAARGATTVLAMADGTGEDRACADHLADALAAAGRCRSDRSEDP
jgi:2-phosphosulfolactate phosphatase